MSQECSKKMKTSWACGECLSCGSMLSGNACPHTLAATGYTQPLIKDPPSKKTNKNIFHTWIKRRLTPALQMPLLPPMSAAYTLVPGLESMAWSSL